MVRQHQSETTMPNNVYNIAPIARLATGAALDALSVLWIVGSADAVPEGALLKLCDDASFGKPVRLPVFRAVVWIPVSVRLWAVVVASSACTVEDARLASLKAKVLIEDFRRVLRTATLVSEKTGV